MNTILTWQRPFSADLESAIERLGWVLVHSLWQFFIVVLITFFVLRVMQRNSARARYGFLVGVTGFMVLIPIATWMVMPRHIRIDSSDQQASVTQFETNAEPTIELNFPVGIRDSDFGNDRVTQLPDSNLAVSIPGIEPSLPLSRQNAASSTEPTWTENVQSAVQPWLIWIVAGWVIGVVLCSLRPILGWRTLRRLHCDGVSTVSEDVQAAVRRLSNQLGLRHVVSVMQSTLIKVPVVVGYLRPVILLPVSLLTKMPPAQLEAILAHELAHVARHDFVINLLQTMIETLFFYHPAVWWLSHRIRVEREHCCDDMVVTCLGNNVEYGRALLAIAEHNGRYSVLALGVADGSLLSRVRRIVGVGSDGTPQRWIDRWPAVLSVFTLIGVAAGLLIWNGMKQGNELPEPVTEAGVDVKHEPLEITSPMLKISNFDGTPARSVPVALASIGYPHEATSYWSGFTDSEGIVSLEKLPSGTHWLNAGGDSSVSTAFEITLPTQDAVINRHLRKSSEITIKDVSVVARVEGEFPQEEIIFVEITNWSSKTISFSPKEISFTTYPDLCRALVQDVKESTIELKSDESIALSIEWPKLVRDGLWKFRLDEELDKKWTPMPKPGKIQVRAVLCGSSTSPCLLTSPESIIAQVPPVVPSGRGVVDAPVLKRLGKKSKSETDHGIPSNDVGDDFQKTVELRLDTAFHKDFDGVRFRDVLKDIAEQLGAKLNIDHTEIWADGVSDDFLLTEVTLTDPYNSMKRIEGVGNLSDWAVSMLARGDGTISFREILSAFTEPWGLNFRVVGDTLQISSREQIELMQKTQSSVKKNFDTEEDQGLRTRVVCAWRSQLWKPIALKIEVRNFSNAVRQFYRESRMPDEVLKVAGPDGKPARFRSQTNILAGGITSINPGETVIFFETDDISKFFELTQFGQYGVHYNGQDDTGRRIHRDTDVCSLPPSLPELFELRDVPVESDLEYVNVKSVIREFNAPPDQRIMDVDFRNSPLHVALEKICNAAFLKLELDVEGLKAVGVTKNVTVTVKAEDKPLQEVLTLLLKPFERLSFTIDKNRVFVNSRERVAAREKERVQAIAEVPVANGDQQNPKEGDAEQSSKDLETDNILGRIVSLDAKGISLREALIQLARAAMVPLELDEPELIIVKFDLNAPVTIKIVDEKLWTAITQLIELNDDIDLQQIIASRPGSRKLFLTTLNGYVKRNLDDSPDWMKPSDITGLHPSIDDDGQVVSVIATTLTDDLLKRLTELPKLRELDISGETKLTAEGLVHFADFPVLEDISISGSANLEAGIADEIVKQIVRVKSLRTLRLSETGVTDAGIRMLKGSPLTSLSLYQEGRITDEALAVIVTLNRLKHLSLMVYVGTQKLGWMRISPAGMNQLSSMKNLESLVIPGQPASVDLTGFSRLISLDMGGEFIDDAAAQRISELRGLRNLTLADVRMTEAGWKKIGTLTGLQRISVSRSRISDEVLSAFQGMTKLNYLELGGYGFSDIGLGYLAHIKSLDRLDLSGSNITVQGLQQLRELPNLRTLWLNGFRDQGSYLGLKDLQQLRELSFLMSNINQAEYTELEKAMPKTRITSMTGGGSLRSIRNPNAF